MEKKKETLSVTETQPLIGLTNEEREAFLRSEEQWICELCQSKEERLGYANEGGYEMPYRELVNGPSWETLCEAAQVDQGYGHLERDSQPDDPEHGGFENKIFAIRPYDWSEPDEFLPNFEHKPSGFKLWWYKYAFRGADMNYDLSAKELARLFRLCALHLGVETRSPRQSLTVQALIEYLQTHFKGDEIVLGVDVACPDDYLAITHLKKVWNPQTQENEVVICWDEFEEDEA